ncbi:GntR family transcriptional regulator [Peptoniphilus sp. ING2-D1G]|nr:GntR family transcriptional regulator [Peptoniphilus sp. ING2-D1G]
MVIKPKSYKQLAYEELKENIIEGTYKPNQVLNERSISEDFGISRTPIREAFQRLYYEGWLVTKDNKKNVVREFNLEYIIMNQKVRESLEILAIIESIDKFKDSDVKNLEKITEEQEQIIKEGNFYKYIKLDRKFHEYIYLISENSVLTKILSNLNDTVRYFGQIALSYPNRQEQTVKEHRKIIEEIKNKDERKAAEAMKIHMENTLDAIKYSYK